MLIEKVYKCLKIAQSVVFPGRCLLCNQSVECHHAICSYCTQVMPWLEPEQCCYQCALPLIGGGICGRCQQKPWPIEYTLAMVQYCFPIDILISRLKFQHHLPTGRSLSQLFWQRMHTNLSQQPDVMIPVPLHPNRLRMRGFNQSSELFKSIAKRLGIKFDVRCADRVIDTVAQSSLSAKARVRNLRRSFLIRPHAYQHVVLVDDVITTGSTVVSLADALKKSGVRRVDVWCLARTVKNKLG